MTFESLQSNSEEIYAIIGQYKIVNKAMLCHFEIIDILESLYYFCLISARFLSQSWPSILFSIHEFSFLGVNCPNIFSLVNEFHGPISFLIFSRSIHCTNSFLWNFLCLMKNILAVTIFASILGRNSNAANCWITSCHEFIQIANPLKITAKNSMGIFLELESYFPGEIYYEIDTTAKNLFLYLLSKL